MPQLQSVQLQSVQLQSAQLQSATPKPGTAATFWWQHGVLPALLALLLFAWSEYTTFDLQISRWITQVGAGHFIDNWFLNDVMHDGVRKLGYVMAYALLIALLLSVVVPALKPARLPLLFVVLSIAVGSSSVVELKHLTNVYCPYDLTLFGGDQTLHSPFNFAGWTRDANNGQCWPGGHSSYGFSLWAFYFIAREYRPRLTPWLFAAVFTYGNILGSMRVIQGAHFLSHQWWTALICWFITLGFYAALLRRDLLPLRKMANSARSVLKSPVPEASLSD